MDILTENSRPLHPDYAEIREIKQTCANALTQPSQLLLQNISFNEKSTTETKLRLLTHLSLLPNKHLIIPVKEDKNLPRRRRSSSRASSINSQ